MILGEELYLALYADEKYMNFDYIEAVDLVLLNSKISITFATARIIRDEINRLIKENLLTPSGLQKTEILRKKLNLLISKSKKQKSLREHYTNIFAKEIINVSKNISKISKSVITAEKKLVDLEADVNNLSDADKLLIELSNFDD